MLTSQLDTAGTIVQQKALITVLVQLNQPLVQLPRLSHYHDISNRIPTFHPTPLHRLLPLQNDSLRRLPPYHRSFQTPHRHKGRRLLDKLDIRGDIEVIPNEDGVLVKRVPAWKPKKEEWFEWPTPGADSCLSVNMCTLDAIRMGWIWGTSLDTARCSRNLRDTNTRRTRAECIRFL